MNLENFATYIKGIPDEGLDRVFNEIAGKHKRARVREIKLGYALALDELAIERESRRQGPVPAEIQTMTDDELLQALTE